MILCNFAPVLTARITDVGAYSYQMCATDGALGGAQSRPRCCRVIACRAEALLRMSDPNLIRCCYG
jgi:hypothetical protein